jgi:transposase-like protein
MNRMGVIVGLEKSPELRRWRQEAEDASRAEGEAKGKAEVLARLLERRFGALPNWARTRIASASATDLDRWVLLVLDVGSIEEALAAARGRSELPQRGAATGCAPPARGPGLAELIEWEMNRMGVIVDLNKNPVLRRWRQAAEDASRAEGRAEGRIEGMAEVLARLLEQRFGALPKWARIRIAHASETDLDRWVPRVLNAGSLTEALSGPP